MLIGFIDTAIELINKIIFNSRLLVADVINTISFSFPYYIPLNKKIHSVQNH